MNLSLAKEMFPKVPTVLVSIRTGCIDPLPNLIGGRLLQSTLDMTLNAVSQPVSTSFFIRMNAGFLAGAASQDILQALRATKAMVKILVFQGNAEIGWWDPSELIVRDFYAPSGLPFERHLPELAHWNDWHLGFAKKMSDN